MVTGGGGTADGVTGDALDGVDVAGVTVVAGVTGATVEDEDVALPGAGAGARPVTLVDCDGVLCRVDPVVGRLLVSEPMLVGAKPEATERGSARSPTRGAASWLASQATATLAAMPTSAAETQRKVRRITSAHASARGVNAPQSVRVAGHRDKAQSRDGTAAFSVLQRDLAAPSPGQLTGDREPEAAA